MYKKYHLASTPFSVDYFKTTWGHRLAQAGHHAIYDQIVAEGQTRRFLATPLTIQQKTAINTTETPITARDAKQYHTKIQSIPIKECGEPLVDLRDAEQAKRQLWSFTKKPYHEACGAWAGKQRLFLVRETVAKKVAQLSDLLKSVDTTIHFEDGFRPTGVQEGLFTRRIAMARETHPDWNEAEIMLEARSKTAYTPRLAAHKAGAALDIRLKTISSGAFHQIGNTHPEGGEIVRLDTPYVTQEEWQNRKILQFFAASVDFLMYPYEDWHICYGDATHATVHGAIDVAKYGPIKEYDAKTGRLGTLYQPDELDATFSNVT